MKPKLRFISLWALSIFLGCDKLPKKEDLSSKTSPEPAGAVESGTVHGDASSLANQTPSAAETAAETAAAIRSQELKEQAARFNADCELWQKRAMEEFPELGKAGSFFNQQFLIEVKKLRDRNAPELSHPNWPYILALQLNTSVERSRNSASSSNSITIENNTKNQSSLTSKPTEERQEKPDRFSTYSVQELTTMKSLPKGGIFRGTITKVEKQVASGDLDVVIVLDGILYCEVNLDQNISEIRNSDGYYPWNVYYGRGVRRSSSLEVIQEQNSLKLVEKRTASSSYRSPVSGLVYSGSNSNKSDLLTLRVGQTISIEGLLLLKANKKPILKGVLKTS